MDSFSKKIFLTGLFFAASLMFSSPVSAQSGSLNLITSPLPVNLTATPGSTVSTELKVKNGGTEEEHLKIDLMKFKAYQDNGQPQLMDPEPSDDFLKWVTFSEPDFTVGPNEWKTVSATFKVPDTAAFGYYYAFVFSRQDAAVQSGSNQASFVGGTAVLVLLDVNVPNAKRQVEVAEFSADKSFYEFLPVRFNVKLKNTGNVHIAPRGNIFISRGGTNDVALLEVNSEKGNILPDSNRVFTTDWKDGFPVYEQKVQDGKTVLDDKGNPVTELTWNWNDASKLRFGKYTAKMLLIYDDGSHDVPIEGIVTFWVMPWRMVMGAIAIPVIPALLVYFFMKRRMRKLAQNQK